MFDVVMIGLERFLILEQRVGRAIDAMEVVPREIAKSIGIRIQDKAQRMMGQYQTAIAGPLGVYPAWEPLKESTLERRASRGVNPADEPLLESGAERKAVWASKPFQPYPGMYIFRIGFRGDQLAGTYAAVHELGSDTNNEPARPVIGPAVMHVMSEPDVKRDILSFTFNHFNIMAD
jgi:hypothetical protein